jgi:hypothetical protein
MSSYQQPSQRPRPHLVRQAPAPISPPRTSPHRQPRGNLVRRVTGPAPASPPATFRQPSPVDHEDDDAQNEDTEGEEEDLPQKQKRGANLLRDALEEEVGRKKRKRGNVK